MMTTEALDALIARLYDAALDPTLWPSCLEELARAVGASNAYVIVHDTQLGRAEVPFGFNVDPAYSRVFEERFTAMPPCARMMHHGDVVRSEELFPSELLERTEIYNEVLKPQGIHHGASVRLLKDAATIGGLMVSRARSTSTFSGNELEVLRRLQPHLRRALQVGSELARAKNRASTLQEVSDLSERGVVLLDESSRVVHLNRLGSSLVEENDGLKLTAAGKLHTAMRSENQRLERLVCDAQQRHCSRGGSMSVSRPSDRPPLLLTIAPASEGDSFELDVGRARVLVLIGVQDAVVSREEQLHAVFGLTRSEATVAAEVARGHSPQEIAASLHVSLPTVRSHLRNIFGKTQVRGQVELVRLLSALPPMKPTRRDHSALVPSSMSSLTAR